MGGGGADGAGGIGGGVKEGLGAFCIGLGRLGSGKPLGRSRVGDAGGGVRGGGCRWKCRALGARTTPGCEPKTVMWYPEDNVAGLALALL